MGQIVVNGEDFLFLENPGPEQTRPTAIEFLKSLPGPTVVDVTGVDRTRTRVVCTLVHGNEPSGLSACLLYTSDAADD